MTELHQKYRTILNKNGINNAFRLYHFFAQIKHESNLSPISENLNYSWKSLRRVFGRYFTNDEIAKGYERKPARIANKVYANRIGNGGEYTGDGYRYRGRGFIQITGRANYQRLTNDTGVDYINNPDLLLTEADSMVSALWFWKLRNLNKFADKDQIYAITRRINGGYNGIVHRKNLLKKYKEFFKA